MRLLLDTHAWLWFETEPERLPPGVESVLADRRNIVLLSVASAWEVSTKYHAGRLDLPEPPSAYVPKRLAETGFSSLGIDQPQALRAGELPLHHRDPFDRLLIAQSQLLDLPLVTGDPKLSAYDVEILWN